MIKRLEKGDISEIVGLHLSCFPTDTLALLGENFLAVMYRGLLSLNDIHAYGHFEKSELRGFVIGVENSQNSLRRVVFHNPFLILFSLFPAILNPKLLKRVIETIFYGQKSATCPAELLIIGVKVNSRKKGIGRKLFFTFSKSLEHKQILKFHISVYAFNKNANSFYKKMGSVISKSFFLYGKKWHVYERHTITKIKKISIVLPTYNEKGNLKKLLSRILTISRKNSLTIDIVVVDDNSPDGTANVALRFAKTHHEIKVIVRKNDHGLAKSIYTGILKADGEYILVMDTDFNHDPNMIPTMAQNIKFNDLIIGSRFINGGGMENKTRNFLSFLFNIYLRLLLNSPTSDHLSGFFLIKRQYLLQEKVKKVFYGFGDYFIRLIYFAQRDKLKIKEIPVFYKNRIAGVSKSRFVPMFITYTLSAIKLRVGKI